jgi:hypothetical protein
MTAHAFDNFPIDAWLGGFDRHFDSFRLSVVITGGESMIDRKNMPILLNHLCAKSSVECVRIDTNAWWKPEQFPLRDNSKIILMCTFHPSQTTEEKFIRQIKELMTAGYKIGMVNYVMDHSNAALFERRRRVFSDLGVVLHPNPLWQSNGTYSDTDLDIMKGALPAIDFSYRSGAKDPFGKACLFPSLSYEMDYKGRISAGCMDSYGSFFDNSLPPLAPLKTTCPAHSCFCLDKYSFLEGSERNISLNPLAEYSKALIMQRR